MIADASLLKMSPWKLTFSRKWIPEQQITFSRFPSTSNDQNSLRTLLLHTVCRTTNQCFATFYPQNNGPTQCFACTKVRTREDELRSSRRPAHSRASCWHIARFLLIESVPFTALGTPIATAFLLMRQLVTDAPVHAIV